MPIKYNVRRLNEYCGKCSVYYTDDVNYCAQCGAAISRAEVNKKHTALKVSFFLSLAFCIAVWIFGFRTSFTSGQSAVSATSTRFLLSAILSFAPLIIGIVLATKRAYAYVIIAAIITSITCLLGLVGLADVDFSLLFYI